MQLGADTAWFCLSQCAIPFFTLSTCLEDNKLIYTEAICAMTLLAKLLPQMEEIA